jgi:hypothetical protein
MGDGECITSALKQSTKIQKMWTKKEEEREEFRNLHKRTLVIHRPVFLLSQKGNEDKW